MFAIKKELTLCSSMLLSKCFSEEFLEKCFDSILYMGNMPDLFGKIDFRLNGDGKEWVLEIFADKESINQASIISTCISGILWTIQNEDAPIIPVPFAF